MVTFVSVMRRAAHQESMALRGWTRAGKPLPPYRPVDWWDEWERHKHDTHTNTRKAASM